MKLHIFLVIALGVAMFSFGQAFGNCVSLPCDNASIKLDKPNYRFIDFSYANKIGEPIMFVLEKTAYDNCNSYDATITNANGEFVWSEGQEAICASHDNNVLVTSEIKIGYNEYHPIIINELGTYFIKVKIDNGSIKQEFIVRQNTSGSSLDRIVYPVPFGANTNERYREITCTDDKQLINKITSGNPACVKLSTAQKLIERGWGVIVESTPSSEDACNLLPDTGMCRAAFIKYYFDSEISSCMQMIWGGCGGSVPFDTLSECQMQCKVNNESLLELFDDEPEVTALYEKYGDVEKSQRHDYISYSAGNGDDFKVKMNLYFDNNNELSHKRLYCYHDNGIFQYEIPQEDILQYLQDKHCLTYTTKRDIPYEPVDATEVINANNQFALDFYSYVSQRTDKNIFFSPWSISTAFAIAHEGSAGNTAKEMQQVFGFPDDLLNGREQYRSANFELNKEDAQYSLDVANALWLQEGFVPNQAYVDVALDYYDSTVDRVDFNTNGVDIINEWVKQKTQEKIEELFPPGSRSTARLAITNAIYFNGTWIQPFNEALTSEDSFWITPTISVQTQMMQTDTVFLNYTQVDSLEILKLPYKGDKLSMLILLPDGKYHIDFFKEILTLENISKWQDSLHKSKVKVIMPKFEMKTDYDLKPILKDLGMNDAFGPADFSKISNAGLYISEAVHKAFVNVNEKGTEAAAATGIIMDESGPHVVRIDHPFLFIIQDDTTGNILFIGSMNNPE